MSGDNYYRNNDRVAEPARKTEDVNPEKLWRTNEKDGYAKLSSIKKKLEHFLKEGDELYIRSALAEAECAEDNKFVQPVLGALKRLAQKTSERGQDKVFTNKVIQIVNNNNKLLEVKNLFKMDDEALKAYMESASPEQRRYATASILEYFRKHPGEKSFEKTNRVLAFFDRKIVKVKTAETSNADKKVLRAAFDGQFTLPTLEDTDNTIGYSAAFEAFADPHHRQKGEPDRKWTPLPTNYNWDDNKTIQAIKRSSNMSKLLPDIKIAMKKQHIPLEVVENMTVSDVAFVLFKETKKREPEAGDHLVFDQVNEECEPGTRRKFWLDFGKNQQKMAALKEILTKQGNDPKYIEDLLTGIRENGTVTVPDAGNPKVYKQPTAKLEAHHEFYIRDAAMLDKVTDVDDISNIKAVVGYDTNASTDTTKYDVHEVFEHGADCEAEGFSYRMVHTDDTKEKRVVLTAGLEKNENIIADVKQPERRITYTQMAEKQEGRA